jgi:hypothetical protein
MALVSSRDYRRAAVGGVRIDEPHAESQICRRFFSATLFAIMSWFPAVCSSVSDEQTTTKRRVNLGSR